jgi:N-acetylglucosamine-6-sulfatase
MSADNLINVVLRTFQLHSLLAFAAGDVTRPSIVLLMTDDQDVEFGGLTPMKHLNSLVGEAGVSASHYYVNTPICCPSRSQMLTGRYAHNIRDSHFEPFPDGAKDCGDEPVESQNVGKCGCMRMNCSQPFEKDTYANHLQRAGYETAYFGKYLNPPAMVRYCRNETVGPLLNGWPSGWDVFYGMCDQASTPQGGYYNMKWVNSESGNLDFTGDDPSQYTTSIIGNKTISFLRRQGMLRQQRGSSASPFFVAAAVRAPHAPQLPPPWYADALPGAAAPRAGSYNLSTEGKPQWLAMNPPIQEAEAAQIDKVFSDRWRCLLAVDDLVQAVVQTLEETGLLDSTFVFFVSDNGYHFGHFRLPPAKAHVYEFDIHVPLLVRGPGVPRNSTMHELIGNVDLGPTFLDIAGIGLDSVSMDGRSFLPLLQKKDIEQTLPWRSVYPIEYYSLVDWPKSEWKHRINDSPNNTYRALRILNTTHDLLYSETTVVSDWWFEQPYHYELYNMRDDRIQARNLYTTLSSTERRMLQQGMSDVWHCQGTSCPGHNKGRESEVIV